MELKTDNVIYHVETFEDAKDLYNKLIALGCTWSSGRALCDFETLSTYIQENEWNLCFRLDNKTVTYQSLIFFKTFETFKDYDFITYTRNSMTKENKKQQSNRKQNAIGNAIQALENQYQKGLRRYDKTIAECDYTAQELFEMAQEELADGLIYTSEALKRLNKERNALSVDITSVMNDIKSVIDYLNECHSKWTLLDAYSKLNYIRKELMTND